MAPSAATASGSSSTVDASGSGSGSGSGSDASGVVTGSTYFDLYHALAARAQYESGEGVMVAVSDDYCMFNATETESSGCQKPRSCSACFRVQGCMLNSTGYCVSSSLHYNETLDFRAATLFKNETLSLRTSYDYWNTTGAARRDAVQSWIFPSTIVDYCAPGDTACELCRLSIFADASKSPDMRYCVGATGCVCTALCDSPQLESARHNATVCDKSKDPSKNLPQPVMWIVGAGVALAVSALLFWWMWRRTSESRGDDDDDLHGDVIRGLTLKAGCDKSVAGPASGAGSTGAGRTSLHSLYQAPPLPDTPVMELSLSEYPRFSMDSSRRRQPPPGDNE